MRILNLASAVLGTLSAALLALAVAAALPGIAFASEAEEGCGPVVTRQDGSRACSTKCIDPNKTCDRVHVVENPDGSVNEYCPCVVVLPPIPVPVPPDNPTIVG